MDLRLRLGNEVINAKGENTRSRGGVVERNSGNGVLCGNDKNSTINSAKIDRVTKRPTT